MPTIATSDLLRSSRDPLEWFAEPWWVDRSTDRLVWSIQQDLVGWAASELVDRCLTAWRTAERLLQAQTVLGMVSAGNPTFPIRAVRQGIEIMADDYRRRYVDAQLPLPFDGLAPHVRYARDWQRYYLDELSGLCTEPEFVRQTLIATAHPDTDLSCRAIESVCGLLRERYGIRTKTAA